jgi:T5orf172 domain
MSLLHDLLEVAAVKPPTAAKPRDVRGPAQPQVTLVYFIQGVTTKGDPIGPIKIGQTINLENRMQGLQTGYPWRLQVLHSEPERHDFSEATLHALFRPIKMHGEWFHNTPGLLKLIKDAKAGRVKYGSYGFTGDQMRGLEPEPTDALAIYWQKKYCRLALKCSMAQAAVYQLYDSIPNYEDCQYEYAEALCTARQMK